MLIKNARIYGQELSDIQIQDEKIAQIAPNLAPQNEEVIDAKGLVCLPSFIDLNVRLKNDYFSLENLKLLENECCESGVCAFVLRDSMDFSQEEFKLFLNHLQELKPRIFPSIRAKDRQNKLKNIASIIDKGANFLELLSSDESNALRQTLLYSKMKQTPIFVQCYESGLDGFGVMNESELCFKLGLNGISEVSETSEVAKMRELGKFYEARLIYDNLSLENSLKLLADDDLTQVSIHHLIKDHSACENYNTFAKLMPPLRDKKDATALKTALKNGKISFLTALHSSNSISRKDLSFDEASFGIHSMREYISLCYTFLVQDGFVSWKELCTYTSKNQAKILGLNAGEIAVGKEANLILFDEKAHAKAPQNSLYANDELKGLLKAHFIRGKQVF